MPIHDELVYSVHHIEALEFLRLAKGAMCHHPEIITDLVLDATASIGRNFEPFSDQNTKGQIEIDESPEILGFKKNSKLNDEQIQKVIDYLMAQE